MFFPYPKNERHILTITQSIKKNRIIVDIDNTLWDFASALWKKMSHLGVPQPTEWGVNFFERYCSLEQFMRYIDEVQAEQDDRCPPFPESSPFLASLKRRGHVTIASHRNPNKRAITESWLNTFGLVYDELHLLPDKTILFDNHQAIVDDDLRTLDKAVDEGLVATGLKFAWNKNSNHALYSKLTDVLEHLDRSDCCMD